MGERPRPAYPGRAPGWRSLGSERGLGAASGKCAANWLGAIASRRAPRLVVAGASIPAAELRGREVASPPKRQPGFRPIQIRGLGSAQETRVVYHVDGAVWLEACFHGIAAVVVDDPRRRVLETRRARWKCHGHRYRGQ